MLLRIMEGHQDWAAVVALVGGGQEINDGEAGDLRSGAERSCARLKIGSCTPHPKCLKAAHPQRDIGSLIIRRSTRNCGQTPYCIFVQRIGEYDRQQLGTLGKPTFLMVIQWRPPLSYKNLPLSFLNWNASSLKLAPSSVAKSMSSSFRRAAHLALRVSSRVQVSMPISSAPSDLAGPATCVNYQPEVVATESRSKDWNSFGSAFAGVEFHLAESGGWQLRALHHAKKASG